MTKRSPGALRVCLVAVWIFAMTTSFSHADEAAVPTGVVRHFVAFKYKDDATPADIAAIDAALVALKAQISGDRFR